MTSRVPIDQHVQGCANAGDPLFEAGKVVLVVDDEPLLVELAVQMLVELGYVPLAFGSGELARTALLDPTLKIDLILTDERMPGLSGSALVAGLREGGRLVPAILMSGNVTAALERRARAAGAFAVLRKPLAREALASAIARCLAPRPGA